MLLHLAISKLDHIPRRRLTIEAARVRVQLTRVLLFTLGFLWLKSGSGIISQDDHALASSCHAVDANYQ